MVTVFSRAWFALQQPRLLGLANHPCTKGLMRNLLGLEHDAPLIRLTPYEATFAEGTRRTTEFHIARAYGMRLYTKLSPVWELLHWFDMRVANPLQQPAWNLGFDTLTSYPDSHPESSTVDGNLAATSEGGVTWNLLRDAASATVVDDTWAIGQIVGLWPVMPNATQFHKRLCRAAYLFDTSSIGLTSTVDAATFRVYGSGKYAEETTMDLNIYSVQTASNTALHVDDYDAFGSEAYSSTISYANFDEADGENAFSFNASGLAAIIKDGVTKIGARSVTHDVGNSQPAGDAGAQSGNQLSGYFADDTTAANGLDPKLIVTYTPANTFVPRLRWW